VVLASFAAGVLAANCYVISAADSGECVVIDPGMDAESGLERVLAQHRLHPVLVLLTHGHFDHVASATAVCERYGAACYIGPADRGWLSDPLAAMTPQAAPLVTDYLAGRTATEPDRFAEPGPGPDGFDRLEAASLTFDLLPAPGHTPGSTLYRTGYSGRDLVFTGDVLFAGTIGRTDLPGGDPAAMDRTLTSTVLSLADETVVLPGHGQRTTIGRERSTNPFLLRE
jgi:glyoxylase-like metal-dependent hydrolase (beta-lactamase superfamily II)